MNAQLSKDIVSARVFLPKIRIDTIIKMLDLKPVDNWMKWVDEEGNMLRLKKNKTAQIFNLGQIKNSTTDIFKKAPPDLISKHSYWLFQIVGKCRCLSSFMGNDGRLRSCYFENGIWKNNIQPLLLDLENLITISNNYLEEEYREVRNTKLKFIDNIKVEKMFFTGDVEMYKGYN